MGTFSKSLASCGGFIAGSHEVIDYLRIQSRAFLFTAARRACRGRRRAGRPAGRALARRARRCSRACSRTRAYLEDGLHELGYRVIRGERTTPIVPVLVEDDWKCRAAVARALRRRRVRQHRAAPGRAAGWRAAAHERDGHARPRDARPCARRVRRGQGALRGRARTALLGRASTAARRPTDVDLGRIGIWRRRRRGPGIVPSSRRSATARCGSAAARRSSRRAPYLEAASDAAGRTGILNIWQHDAGRRGARPRAS